MIQWKNIRQALSEANNSNFFKLMANYETHEVWCDCSEDSNSWNNYSDSAIFIITSGTGARNIKPITKISETEIKDILNEFPDNPQSLINFAGITQLQEWQHDVDEYFQNREDNISNRRV